MTRVWRFLFALSCLLSVTACMTVVRKPCTEGGDPARDKPFAGPLEKKQCEQKVVKGGNYVNHGVYREWHANGRVVLQGDYKEGVKSGKWFEWDEAGKLLSERWFEDGKEVPTREQLAKMAAAVPAVSGGMVPPAPASGGSAVSVAPAAVSGVALTPAASLVPAAGAASAFGVAGGRALPAGAGKR